MTYRIRNIVIAVGLALVAMLLTLLYVTNYRNSVQHNAGSVVVYAAAQDIPAGTNGADIVSQHELRTLTIPRSDVVPGAISSPQQIDNLVSTANVYSGEQITLRRFANRTEQGVRAQLHALMRAIQIPGDANQLLAGTLQAGDHVDVVASVHYPTPNAAATTARVVLRNLLVLVAPTAPSGTSKLSSSTSTSSSGSGATDSVMLQVSEAQVHKLWYVIANDNWSLELRPVSDSTDSAPNNQDANSILGLTKGGPR